MKINLYEKKADEYCEVIKGTVILISTILYMVVSTKREDSDFALLNLENGHYCDNGYKNIEYYRNRNNGSWELCDVELNATILP